MPIRSVEFLQMPCSLSSGEYPLLTSSTQSLAGFTKATLSCRVTDDLRQKIKVPSFSGWSDCNMIRMGGNLYWILEANTSTDSEASVEMIVSYCGPSSIMHKNDAIVGTFSRLPVNKCPYLKRTPLSGSLEHTRTIQLPSIGYFGSVDTVLWKCYWIQVTYQETVSDTVETKRVGYFALWNPRSGDGAVRAKIGDNVYATYISLDDTLADIADAIGTTASSVLDISISERCPYMYQKGDSYDVTLYARSNSTSTPFIVYPDRPDMEHLYRYDLDILYYDPNDESKTTAGRLAPWEDSVTVTLSDLERGCGSVTIRDGSCASLGEIPTAYGSSIALDVRVGADYTGLTTYVTYGGYQIAIPEGHLPWNGTAWEEYRSYSLAYDREAMEMSIDYSNQRVAVGLAQSAASTIQSAAMGAIGGNPVGAVTGAIGGVTSFAISSWATMRESEISTSEARATQALAERRVQGQPSTPYNAGYGLAYCIKTHHDPASIWVEMPAGLTESIDQDYTACYGYPAEGLRSISVQEGYIKGRIYDNGVVRGPRFDRMNEALQNGILFKEI